MPPRTLPQTARQVRIEDVDRGVKGWFERVVAPHVLSPQGELRSVPVIFAAGERWVAAEDHRGIRDRDGRLVLPIMQIARTSLDPITNMTALGSNVPTMQIARLIHPKQSELANLDYSRPISSRRLRSSAVYEVWTVPFPINSIMEYEVLVQAQYLTQINSIIEKILSKLEFFDVPSFVIDLSANGAEDRPAGLPTGQGSTELAAGDHAPYESRKPLSDYFAVGYLDGPLSSGGNLREFTDQERIVQTDFSFKVPIALMVDPEGERPAVQRQTTAFGVFLGDEEVVVVDDPADLDKIFGPEK